MARSPTTTARRPRSTGSARNENKGAVERQPRLDAGTRDETGERVDETERRVGDSEVVVEEPGGRGLDPETTLALNDRDGPRILQEPAQGLAGGLVRG